MQAIYTKFYGPGNVLGNGAMFGGCLPNSMGGYAFVFAPAVPVEALSLSPYDSDNRAELLKRCLYSPPA